MPAAVTAIAATLAGEEPRGRVGAADLREVWGTITDPRDRRGRRHPLVVILALVQAAVVSGASSFAAVRHWIGECPQHVLADIGARQDRSGEHTSGRPAPCNPVCRPLLVKKKNRC